MIDHIHMFAQLWDFFEDCQVVAAAETKNEIFCATPFIFWLFVQVLPVANLSFTCVWRTQYKD